MRYGVRWTGREMGEYWIVDLRDDDRKVGVVKWKGVGQGYWTEDLDGVVVAAWARDVEEARSRHGSILEEMTPSAVVRSDSGMVKCRYCNEWRADDAFPRMRGGKRRSMCRSCVSGWNDLTWQEKREIEQMDQEVTV